MSESKPTNQRATLKELHRTAIVKAVEDFIEERGAAGFSTDEIAERADVSRRTVFVHFDSFDDIVMTICVRKIDEIINASSSELPSREAEDLSTLFQHMAALLSTSDFPSVIPFIAKVIFKDRKLNEALASRIFNTASERLKARLRTLTTHIDELDIDLMTGFLMSGISRVSQIWLRQARGTVDEEARRLWDELIDKMIHTLRTGYSRIQ